MKREETMGKDADRILCRLPTPGVDGLRPESKDIKAKIFSESIIYL
ncbi:MAG: hypothetical protein HC880_03045 [Bacteroidia bacterium]|nr:hypothetical protein [Bacteroidia bacterium]